MTYSYSTEEASINYYEFKIILLGDPAVGKTTLFNNFMDKEYNPFYLTTLNVDKKTNILRINQNTSAKLKIWDTCGQERYRSLTKIYLQGTHGVLLLYDITEENSFKNLDKWLSLINDCINKEEISIILVGNKIDMEVRKISTEKGQIFAEKNNLLFIETSSKDGTNVKDAFIMVTKDIIKKSPMLSPTQSVKAVKGRINNNLRCC